MTLNAVVRAANDTDLQTRIQAAIYEEAINNADLKDTEFGKMVRQGYANFISMYWAVAQAVQNEYQYGVDTGRGSPGHDPDVVSDGAITAAVVVHWPPDSVPGQSGQASSGRP